MKRTKQTDSIVTIVNDYLRENHAKEDDSVFIVMSHALMGAGVYHGFNYYDAEGKLNGKDYDHVQLY